MSRDVYRVESDCPPEWPPGYCHDFAVLVEKLVPSTTPGTWQLRCAHCATVIESELDFFEAVALEAVGAAVPRLPCCPCPAPAAEPTVYARPACPRCGLASAHVHTCAWSPE